MASTMRFDNWQTSDGTSIATSNASGDITFAGGVSGAGKILQVVYGSTSTTVNSSTMTFADTGLTVSITPTSSSSTVVVFVAQNGINKRDNANSQVILKLFRGATELCKFGNAIGYDSTTTGQYMATGAVCYQDSPATTSATTYKTQFANGVNAGTATVQIGNALSTIVAMEVALHDYWSR